MNALWRIGAVALATAAVATPLLAAPADTVRSRIAGYRELGAAFKAVNDGLRGGEVQTVLIAQSAREIRNASRGQYEWFPAGSGPQSGAKTRAKGEIWAQPAKFRTAQDAFAKAADDFQRAVAGKDVAAIRTGAQKLGATCKGCHDSFRAPES
ncbi:c-type cytochrome [Novosphingobium aerophilum]|uniref:c-type cytochrome n=1 Tax=Novosphingobium TaxID=165696 RepID=UPI002D764C76|nr:cytochrome c [Novosphingobium sp. RL4]WRT95040.1 cytochrome c [Novosphingobium sp. RL4]